MKNSRRDFFKWAAALPIAAQVALAYGDESKLRDEVEETTLIRKGRR